MRATCGGLSYTCPGATVYAMARFGLTGLPCVHTAPRLSRLLLWLLTWHGMNVEYAEFESVKDVFMLLSSAAAPMKNTLPINSYRGYMMSFIPLSPNADSFLMVYAAGSLEPGIYEFDVSAGTHTKVKSVERADKMYFVVLTPKRSTIADKALENI